MPFVLAGRTGRIIVDVPNGHDKNWVRVCIAIDGFRTRYGRWPTRIRVPAGVLHDFRLLFADIDFLTISSKIAFELDDVQIVAEDDEDGRYSYDDEGLSEPLPQVRTIDWFGVSVKPAPEGYPF
jgi:hypothetical protein